MNEQTTSYTRSKYLVPEKISQAIEKCLSEYSMTLNDSKKIADCILRTSDFYIQNPKGQTPWSEKWCQIAQIAYYLPLNFLRSQAVAQEAAQLGFPLQKDLLIDFGSGLGAGSLPFVEKFQNSLQVIESSSIAFRIQSTVYQSLGHAPPHLGSENSLNFKNFSALFSFSMTELEKLPKWIENADQIVIIEPSTQTDGRKLLQVRSDLIAKGYSIWAPCPHQDACPLLANSKTDWCHDRIHAELPQWLLNIEKHLPMKNQTLTFGYLLASKKPAPSTNKWRLVGDRQDEKGKSRQMVCKSNQREFLAWMHRNGEPPEWPRGILIDPPENFELKSNEIRLKP